MPPSRECGCLYSCVCMGARVASLRAFAQFVRAFACPAHPSACLPWAVAEAAHAASLGCLGQTRGR